MSCVLADRCRSPQRLEIEVLEVRRRRLQDHLVLVVVLQPVGVLAVAAVLGAARGLDVGGAPGLGAERAQRRGRVEGAGAHLHVVGLQDDAALLGPVALERQDQVLEGQRLRFRLGSFAHLAFGANRGTQRARSGPHAISQRGKGSRGRKLDLALFWPVDAAQRVGLQSHDAIGVAALHGLFGALELGRDAHALLCISGARPRGRWRQQQETGLAAWL